MSSEVVVVDVRFDDSNIEGDLVHLASTWEKAVEWIKEKGLDWSEASYYFALYTAEIDKVDDSFECEDLTYYDMYGNPMTHIE